MLHVLHSYAIHFSIYVTVNVNGDVASYTFYLPRADT